MSKSLGTLTLDLVARTGSFVSGMDKAERSSEKWRKEVEKNAKAVGAAFGAGSAAAIASLTAITVSTVNAAAEISKLSTIAGSSSTEFQKFAAGAQLVGIEQDKLADILKDVTEKAGEFAATGGGGMKDFFEQIAPQVGVTADQFAALSGPQALGLYVDTLEKAGVSQQQMTFYMESLASDATALIPLLKDNGAAMKGFADEAERAGAILSEQTIAEANKLRAAMYLMDQATTGLKNQIGSALIPVLGDFADGLSGVTVDGSLAATVSEDLAGSLRAVGKAAVGAVAAIHIAGSALKDLYDLNEASKGGGSWWETYLPPVRIYRAFESMDEIKETFSDSVSGLDQLAQGYGEFLNKLDGQGNGGGGSTRLETLTELFNELQTTMAPGALPAAITSTTKAIESQDEAVKEQNKALEAYQRLIADLRTDEEQLTDQMRERLAVLDAMQGIEPDERMKVAGRIAGAATTDAPEFGGLDAAVGGPFGELLKIDEAEEKLQEWYDTQLEMLEQFRQDRADLAAVWDEEELALKQQHEDELARIEQARQMAQLASAESIFGDLAGLTKTFAGEQSGLYKAMFAVQKAAAIAQSAVAIQQGIAMAAANPWPANLAAMASVAAATASIVSNIGAIGMAHDGIDSIPQTGTWLLEKGERVTTAETSAKLDKTLSDIQGGNTGGGTTVNVIEDASKRGTTERRTGADGREEVNVFVSDIFGDGPRARAIAQKFGLSPAGR
ncbi:phage tail tape measure protein [Stutzerimonas kunmingensis]|uniref:phage tail tape measure protein n=1 Tax=Stutzerimonas kunmingensis TaxID=1211807 RepID=UPI001F332878|nr:phage tail tape measure protein [Stutzerimonas kunmingensis]UIP34337.1 phage tail tape measure protein [Stutzerimonas kunmingensis]